MNNLSGKPQVMKKINNSLIKRTLKDTGSATKAQISEITGISATTVRTLLEELIENKEIVSVGLDDSSGGRRAQRYALNIDENIVLSFYVEDNFINYTLANPLGEIIENKVIEIEDRVYKESLENFIDQILKRNNIKVIGIGVSGVVDKGNYFSGKDLTNWEKYDIGDYIEGKYNIPVILENDLNAIALGFSLNCIDETKMLEVRSLDLVYIHFTEAGVGAGIMANGELIHGKNNFAGEVGFMPINKEGHLSSILTEDINDERYVDIVSQVIAILNCVTNPSFIVIGGDSLRRGLVEDIKEMSKKYFANNISAEIILSDDYRRDYLSGINYLASEYMYSDIQLINSQK